MGDSGPTAATETTAPASDTAARLLAVIREVALEIRPHMAGVPVTLDSSLDADLGFDSLGRVELMVRVERAFGVALSDAAFAAAEAPRDILRAVLGAADAGAPVAAAEIDTAPLAGAEAIPFAAATLTEVLDWHAGRHPDRPHVRLYGDAGEGADDDARRVITFKGLRDGAVRVAAGLQAAGLEPGRSVVIMLPTGRDYFDAFFGILYAGGVPVPIYPPGRPAQIEEHLRRHAAIVDNCQGTFLITVPDATRFGQMLAGLCPSLGRVTTVAELSQGAGAFTPAAPKPGDTAFLQYTSGSTGDPKGVILSHANLLANIRAMGEALETDSRDVFVSWLPLYHDMGLIGAWLGNLHFANPVVVMPPLAFLSRPHRWLRAIDEAKATLSAAPNFAYELCLTRVRDADIEGLELGSWRLALNGAEAVNPETLRRFSERFGAYGFRPEAMFPVFGLAENAVGLTFPPLGRGPLVDRVRRDAFTETGRAEPADDGDAVALEFVNCGRPLPRHQVRVVDDAGRELPEREEGRLQFRGPSATSGYLRNPAATAALFDGDWLNTGDLAYVAGGDVHLTGRTKDVIIRGGRNIYPAELEDAVGGIDGLRKGNVAVFGSADPETGTERLVVLAETRKRDVKDQDAIRARVNELTVDLIGQPPDDVVLAPPRTVLKTSSGKVRRGACRDVYEQGLIGKPAAAVWWQVARLGWASLGPRLRRASRRAGIAAFGAFAWALVAVVGPLIYAGALVLPTVGLRWRGLGALVRMSARLLGIGLTLDGAENLPAPGTRAVFVSNHCSYIDAFVLGALLPHPVRFVTKAELAGSWPTRVPLRAIGAEFVERFDRRQSLDDADRLAAVIQNGHWPLFFAEGTLSRMPGLLPFHLGAFAAAVDAEACVVPVVVRGTRSILRDGTWMPRPGAASVSVAPPVTPPEAVAAEDGGGTAWARAVALRNKVRGEILTRTGEPDLAREDVFADVLRGAEGDKESTS